MGFEASLVMGAVPVRLAIGACVLVVMAGCSLQPVVDGDGGATGASSAPAGSSGVGGTTSGMATASSSSSSASTSSSSSSSTGGCSAGGGSANPGAWVSTTLGPAISGQQWESVASDATGTRIAAGESGWDLWTGVYSGGSWTWTDASASLGGEAEGWGAGVVLDSTGTQLAGASADIWTAAYSGGGWSWANATAGSPAHGEFWEALAGDSTLTHLAAVGVDPTGDNTNVWAGTNSGGGWSWTNAAAGVVAAPGFGRSIASDASGAHLAVPGYYSGLWVGDYAGGAWTWANVAAGIEPEGFGHVAFDATGTHLAATSGGVPSIWTGVYAGNAWTWTNVTTGTAAQDLVWTALASDPSGTHLSAASYNGDVWTGVYSCGAWSWTNQTAGGSASGQNWNAIASDSSGTHLIASASGQALWTN